MFLASTFPASTFQAGPWGVLEEEGLSAASTREAGLEVGVGDGDSGYFAIRRDRMDKGFGVSLR